MRILMGGSPCTYWSIAQTKNRETKPEGLGWELFENYLISLEKFKPDYFLYENNYSMNPSIRKQITKELGVEPIMINSALVSAQNRKRLYWTNIPGVGQPADLGISFRDVLDSELRLNSQEAHRKDGRMHIASKPICVNSKSGRNGIPGLQPSLAERIYSVEGKWVAVTTAFHPNIAAPAPIGSEVRNGHMMVNGKPYPIQLPNGFYNIRKPTIAECKRLQTVPEDYIFPVSNTQAYKMLGNGWTCDVISHILSYCPGITTEPLTVLSMYDGMSCGRIALNKLNAQISRYFATEIDKYAVKTSQTNFPDIIHLGDAFQVREDNWGLPV